LQRPRHLSRAILPLALLLPAAVLVITSWTKSSKPQEVESPPVAQVDEVKSEPTPEPTPEPRFAPLTGVSLTEEEFQVLRYQRPVSVVIDNNISATPQSGLDHADVVIEALVEGGITRFLAIYHSASAPYIEPVRSARTPFVQWALEYDAMFAHVGSADRDGDADAGAQIVYWAVADLDFEGGPWPARTALERNPQRRAPHNVRTSTDRLRAEGSARGYEHEFIFTSWQFAKDASGLAPGTPAPSFSVHFGSMSPGFSPRWDWNPDLNGYVRSQFGGPQFDAYSGAPLAFSNVVVLYDHAAVVDASAHVLYNHVGEGRAQVFRNGEMVEATWRKAVPVHGGFPERDDLHQRTQLFGPDGQEIVFAPGKTWIEVVTLNGSATIQ
jgi:Protein of unknown function (DUF3048) N-terminal domain/Protein of unknown function (DUF3048) C-terminal domain